MRKLNFPLGVVIIGIMISLSVQYASADSHIMEFSQSYPPLGPNPQSLVIICEEPFGEAISFVGHFTNSDAATITDLDIVEKDEKNIGYVLVVSGSNDIDFQKIIIQCKQSEPEQLEPVLVTKTVKGTIVEVTNSPSKTSEASCDDEIRKDLLWVATGGGYIPVAGSANELVNAIEAKMTENPPEGYAAQFIHLVEGETAYYRAIVECVAIDFK